MYHYTESGLDNVWLANGYTEKETPYGRAVAVTHADELHKAIADQLIKKPSRLTGKELRFLRIQMGISQAVLARAQGVTEQNVSLWERHGKVPKANDALVRLCYLAHSSGNESLKKAFDAVMNVERLVNQKIVVTSGRSGWKSRVEEAVPRNEAVEA